MGTVPSSFFTNNNDILSMNNSLLHLFHNDYLYIAYQPSSMDLYTLNAPTYKSLKQMMEQGCCSTDVITDETKRLLQMLKKSEEDIRSDLYVWPSSTDHIDRITLHVANDCNLRCKYCYANGGHYLTNRELMSKKTAQQFIDFCQTHFQKVQCIVFFGGEPLLNIPVIEYICETFKALYRQRKIAFLPEFGIITNGTILNEQVIRLVEENFSFVTVSIDGPKEINDAVRVFIDGSGTFDKISNFIRTLSKHTHVKLRYEATLTHQHLAKGYTIESIAKELTREFGIDGDVVNEMSLPTEKSFDYWKDFDYEKWKREGGLMPDGFWSVLRAIRFKIPKNMCNIAYSTFAVATNGEIYPCHINTDVKEVSLGHIAGKNFFNDKIIREKSFPTPVKENDACSNCWANGICGGCARAWFYDEENRRYQKLPKAEICKQNLAYLENLLMLIATIRKDENFWKTLVRKSRPYTQHNC